MATRREVLRDMAVIGTGAFVANIVRPAVAEAQQINTKTGQPELPPTVQYFPQAAESTIANNKGEVLHIAHLEKDEIFIAQAQKLEIIGAGVFSVNPLGDPNVTVVFAVLAENDIDDFRYKSFPNVAVWKSREKTTANAEDRIDDLMNAASVQASRAFLPGNCNPHGCTMVRFFIATAKKMPTNGQVAFPAIINEPTRSGLMRAL